VSALVSLDLEHTELLGKTLLEIACDKLDATARGGRAILGESCLPFAEEIRAYAALCDIALEFVDPASWRDRGAQDGLQHFDLGGWRDLRSRLVGPHQINNHAVAAALIRERLKLSGAWPLGDVESRWRTAIARVIWPGRLETISDDPLVVIDVGHTPEGIKAALAGFRTIAGACDAILVTGGSKNKHVQEMLALLVPSFDRIIATEAHHNGLAAQEVENLVRAIHPRADITHCPEIADAARRAREDAMRTGRTIYVAGGLFLAAEFAEAWRGGAPEALRFF
jgi:dihydrofolate synthase/folylpolyglutamate synthase